MNFSFRHPPRRAALALGWASPAPRRLGDGFPAGACASGLVPTSVTLPSPPTATASTHSHESSSAIKLRHPESQPEFMPLPPPEVFKGVLLPAAGCGSAAARSVSSSCAKFVRHAWEPYIGRQHDACWRFSLPPNGVGDLLKAIVPLTAEAMLMNRSLEIRIRNGGAGNNNTVLGALGLFERPALAPCQQAKRVEEWDSAHARTISGMWSRNFPFTNGGHRLASNKTHRTHETLNCMLRLYLCPKPAVLQQQAALKAQLRSSRQKHLGLDTTWVALHARLAAGSFGTQEGTLLAGVQEAWEAGPTANRLSVDDSNTHPTAKTGLAPRAALFESFLSSVLPHICNPLPTINAVFKHSTQLISLCPEMCSRSRQNASLGVMAAFAAVDRALNASGETRFFFSTDALPLQRFAEQTFGNRLVHSVGAPMHSSIANAGADTSDDLVLTQDTIKVATDFLMYLDARRVVQLAPSTFSAVLPHRRAADVLTLLRCELLSGNICKPGCEAMPEAPRPAAAQTSVLLHNSA